MNTTAARSNSAVMVPARRRARNRAEHRTPVTLVEWAILIALTAAVVAAVLASGTTASTDIATTVAVRVEPGETLWEVAASHAAPGESTREIVERIGEINGLEDATVQAGQTLYVPAVPDQSVALAAR